MYFFIFIYKIKIPKRKLYELEEHIMAIYLHDKTWFDVVLDLYRNEKVVGMIWRLMAQILKVVH